jgi:hypothetical protein
MEIELIFAFARAKKVLRGPYVARKKELALARKMREERGRKNFRKLRKQKRKSRGQQRLGKCVAWIAEVKVVIPKNGGTQVERRNNEHLKKKRGTEHRNIEH